MKRKAQENIEELDIPSAPKQKREAIVILVNNEYVVAKGESGNVWFPNLDKTAKVGDIVFLDY